MKHILLAILLLFVASNTALAQTYEMTWQTIDNGGGVIVSGDIYMLVGTFGQPDAGPKLAGGIYELRGGFWAGVKTSPPCPGDLNSDAVVDLNDLAILLGNYGATGATMEQGDLNGDTNVDLSDLAILLSHYGDVCS